MDDQTSFDYTLPPPPEKKKFDPRRLIKWALWAVGGYLFLLIVGPLVFFVLFFARFKSPAEGVEIIFPKTWSYVDHPPQGVIVSFIAPKENALSRYTDTYNVFTRDLSSEPMTLEQYVAKTIKETEATYTDAKLIEHVIYPVGGKDGHRLVFSINGDWKGTLAVWINVFGNTAYHILYLGPEGHYEKNRLMMDVVAMTLKVKR